MASCMEEKCMLYYAMIANIPEFYHSYQLRNYFSTFVEQGGFECFHYRHRPENTTAAVSSNKLQGTIITSCCVIIKLKTQDQFENLKKLYHQKPWLDRNEEPLASVCHISRIRILPSLFCYGRNSLQHFNKQDLRKSTSINLENLTEEGILDLPEMNPPDIMPNGNVGTPTQFFLKLIQLSKLSPKIITKLRLVFPKMQTNRKYGSVSYHYGDNISNCGINNNCFNITPDTESEHTMLECWKNKHLNDGKNCTIPKQSDMDNGSECDSDSEEWERHESLHDDPSNQERNNERLFEDKMDIVWEKGGPGIVWYTDAQFWNEQEEEEEKDADDWDVDFSEYYNPGTGDKDARDIAEMQNSEKNKIRTNNTNKTKKGCVYPSKVGQFECFSKGIGRKVLMKYGWKDGKGLGSAVHGMAYALDNDGQPPHDKTGFGYRGVKLCKFSRIQFPPSQKSKCSKAVDGFNL